MSWLQTAPIGWVAASILAGLVLVHELALQLGRRVGRQGEHSDIRGYMISSALALLGLLMAFTFSAAQERFGLREQLGVVEANALGTTYHQFQLVKSPWREALSACLLRYAETRLRFAEPRSAAEMEAGARRAAVYQDRIWKMMPAAVQTHPVPMLTPALVHSADQSFDVAASRRAAQEMRVPAVVLQVLLISSLMVSGLLGYTEAAEQRQTGVLIGILALLTLALCLILDLDRPVGGAIAVSQLPMQRTLDEIRRGEAGRPADCTGAPAPPAATPP
jgi:hypothetical protein